MERTEAVRQAYLIAYEGYKAARKTLGDEENLEDINLAELSSMAAQIYRQMTSVIVMTMGSEERRARKSDLEVLESVVGKAGIMSPYLLGSHDLHIYSTNSDTVQVIINELMGENAVIDCSKGGNKNGGER